MQSLRLRYFFGFLGVAFALASCAAPKHDSLTAEFRSGEMHIALSAPDRRIQLSGVYAESNPSVRGEALDILKNQSEFLSSYYRQSYDPYVGKAHFPESCLKRNRVGAVQVGKVGAYVLADVFTSASGQPGFCPGWTDAARVVVLYAVCPGSPTIGVYQRKVADGAPLVELRGELQCE